MIDGVRVSYTQVLSFARALATEKRAKVCVAMLFGEHCLESLMQYTGLTRLECSSTVRALREDGIISTTTDVTLAKTSIQIADPQFFELVKAASLTYLFE